MSTKSDNIEIMMGDETNDIIEELFKSLLQKYLEGLEESLRESKFIFDSVDLLKNNEKGRVIYRSSQMAGK